MGKPYTVKPYNFSMNNIVEKERTQGSEPSQYLKEKKETSIPKVVASEIGTAQTFCTQPAIKSGVTHIVIEPVYSVTGIHFEKQQDLTWLRVGCSRGCRAGDSRVTNLVVS